MQWGRWRRYPAAGRGKRRLLGWDEDDTIDPQLYPLGRPAGASSRLDREERQALAPYQASPRHHIGSRRPIGSGNVATPPDPVGDATGYQRFILSKLGDDDPAEVQAGTPLTLRELFREAGDRLRRRPAPTEWSVLEVAGHMLDAEMVATARYRWILAEDQPRLVAYDQESWMDRLRHNEDDPDEVLSVFEALRAANLSLWSRSSEADRARIGLHDERGPES